MKSRSIRWQLPLSYAAIAFLAALSLGIVLLTILRSHYINQEREYLHEQARAYARFAGRLLEEGASDEQLADVIRRWGFLSDTRIVLTDDTGAVLADSGLPQMVFVELMPAPGQDSQFFSQGFNSATLAAGTLATEGVEVMQLDNVPDTIFYRSNPNPPVTQSTAPQVVSINFAPYDRRIETEPGWVIPISRSPFGVDFNAAFSPEHRRSNQAISAVIQAPDEQGTRIGTLRISDGPAYGTEILDSVARGWMFAGGCAVLLAVLVGWFISSRITAPLVALTHVTTRMMDGDLAVRTQIQRRDELGTLGRSFNEMADRIEHTVVTLRRFVADAAHELHTPLTALRTNLELLQEMKDVPAAQRALEQVRRMAALADDLLDLSRIETQVEKPTYQPIDVNQLVQETSAVYASRAEQTDVTFELALPDEHLTVMGSPVQLQRMLCNVLDNAIKFTPAGGTIRVGLERRGRAIELRVQDTGIGIPEDDMPFLFERFRRGRNTASYPGSGLGLAIVKAIVDAHGGHVAAASDGHGTTVAARLPLVA